MRKKTDAAQQMIKSPSGGIVKKVVDDALQNGFAFRSMRAIAETSGISHRMLNYHFGSHYGLLTAIIKEVRAGESELFKAETENVNSVADLEDFFLTFWRRYTTDKFRAFYQLHFETYSYALRHREECSDFLEGVVEPWVEALSQLFKKVGFSEEDANQRASIILASMRGFSLDFITTGDADRIEIAGKTLLKLVCAKSSAST